MGRLLLGDPRSVPFQLLKHDHTMSAVASVADGTPPVAATSARCPNPVIQLARAQSR